MVGLAVLGSQAGHLLAYQVRFGAAALQIQGTGAHSYFPIVARTAIGAAGAVLLASLFLVALARILAGRRVPVESRPSYVSLLAGLFTIQLAVFAAQEVGEAMAAGAAVASAPQLLLWGTLGQLPVGAVGALALRWLLARVEGAVGAIREVIASVTRVVSEPALVAVPVYATPDRALLMSRVVGSSLAKRGPPVFLPISTR